MRRDEDANPEPPTWGTLIAHASDIALTTDDLLVATSNDGTIWLCSVTRRRWLSVSTGITDLDKIVTNADGDEAIAVDRQGRLISIDLDAARKLLDVAR